MNIEELLELGSRCRAVKDFAGALKHYLRALELDPEDRSILLALGDVYRGLNDYESSLEVWTRGIQDNPKDVAILTRIADAHKRLGHRDLAVEQMRLGDRLRVEWQWDESLEGLEGPPFLLQPLVENALKHGINPCPEGGEVGLGLARVGEEVVLWVSNTGRPLPLVLGNGVGVGNLEARLNLAFGPHARFRLHSDGTYTTAEISIAKDALRRTP